jgi:endonuclease/exonuclease/phosphatase family metal-dependent hydrolase
MAADMRLVSYNILDGGEGRADPLAEVILAQRPDIVAIIEADNAEVLARIASRLKMDFVCAEGKKSSVALFSRWTIRESINHGAIEKISKACMEATVVDHAGNEWLIGALHLPAHALQEDEEQRDRELRKVLEIFAPHREANRPHLICGDFNSNSPVQKIDIARCKPATQKEYKKNGNEIPRRVIRRMLSEGYLDSLETFDANSAASNGSFTTQFPGQRVDYIFTHGFDRSLIKSAWIETDRLAKYASDHFPIGMEIEAITSQRKS